MQAVEKKIHVKKEKIHSTPVGARIGNSTSAQVISFFVNSLYQRTYLCDDRFLILRSSGTCRRVSGKMGQNLSREIKVLKSSVPLVLYLSTRLHNQCICGGWVQITRHTHTRVPICAHNSTVIPRLTKIIRSGITFVSRNVISRRFL